MHLRLLPFITLLAIAGNLAVYPTVVLGQDNPPTPVCQNITAYLDGAGTVNITAADLDGGSFDNEGPINYGTINPSFSCSDIGANNVVLVVIDNVAQRDSCISVVTVVDSTRPVVVLPSSDTFPEGTPLPGYDDGSTDNCALSALVQSPPANTILTMGDYDVQVTGFDPSGNSASGTVDVTVSAALPVELTRFDVSVAGNTARLSWATESELNNSGFAVEQASGTRSFVEVAFVEGRGTTQDPQSYSTEISGLDPGTHVFRLKQVDFDGSYEYSAIVEATVSVPDQFLIEEAYPNPFNPSTSLRFAVASSQRVDVTLVNASGQLVGTLFSGSATANQTYRVTVDGSSLASGAYIVRFAGESFLASRQILLVK